MVLRISLRAGVVLAALLLAGSAAATAQEPLTLEQAVARALAQSRLAETARANRDASRYRDNAFYSRQLPRLTLGGTVPSYNRAIIPVLQPDGSTSFRPQDQVQGELTATMSQTLPLTGGDFFVSSALSRLSVSGQQTTRTWSSTPVEVGLRQPLFRSNDNGWDRKEQPLRAEVAERQYREAREDIALETANLYFDVHAAQVALRNAEANAATNDTLFTLNKGRYEVGRIGENDLLQSELALLRSRNALDEARLQYQRALSGLRLVLNMAPGEPLAIAVSTTVPDFTPDTTLAVAEALRNRSVASDAELQAVQARRRINEARLNNGLGATVSASYGFNATGTEARSAYQNLLEARQFILAVDIPLLQWGLRKESVQAARADRDRVESTTRLALDQAAQEAHFAALELVQARRNLLLSAKADTVALRRFDVAYNRYVIGRIAIDNLYIAQSEKDAALTQFVQALRGYWQAYYRLRRVTLFDFETGNPLR